MNEKVIRIRRYVIIILVIAGLLLIGGSFAAEFTTMLGWTPGFGVLQTLGFLLGVTGLTIAGYLYLAGRRPPDKPPSLQAEIGIRLSSTGLVLAYVGGFADLIRIGTHVEPSFPRPFIGPLQWGAIILGLIMIALGMLFYATARGPREKSSLEFIIRKKSE